MFVTAYGPKLRPVVYCPPEEDRAKQEFADEANINVLMARYMNTGAIPEGMRNPALAEYMDTTTAVDLQTALEVVRQAEDLFAELPAKVRDRFRNDPALLLEFMEDRGNLEEARALGLVDTPSNRVQSPATARSEGSEGVAMSEGSKAA